MRSFKLIKLNLILCLAMCLAFQIKAQNANQDKEPEKEKLGTIEVTAAESASVYIEGFLAGKTPVSVAEVRPGSYHIVVKLGEGTDYSGDVVVVAGKTTTARVGDELTPNAGGSPQWDGSGWSPSFSKDEKKQLMKAKSKQKLGSYQVLEISNFIVKSENEIPPDHLYGVFPAMAKWLDKKGKFSKYVTVYTNPPTTKSKSSSADKWNVQHEGSAPTLILTGVITEYNRGNRAQRYFVGFGAGAAKISCSIRLTDKATGEVVFEKLVEGVLGAGLFGGSSSEALNILAAKITDAINKNW